MAVPIVFIHKSNSDYLPYALLQARVYNTSSPIYLIGDRSTQSYKTLFKHRLIDNYSERAKEFAKVYRHNSTNGHDYELFCLQRWFILQEFMEQEGIENCLYLDSDVLYYANAEAEYRRLKQYDLTVLVKSPHTNYINSISALNEFNNFIWAAYTGPLSETLLTAYLTEHHMEHGQVGGISDMTFFLQYRKINPEKVADLSVPTDGIVYDITLDTPAGFQMRDGKKQIFWKLGYPYGKEELSSDLVRFATLHFQGSNKQYLQQYLSNFSTKDHNKAAYFVGVYNRQRVLNKIFKIFGIKK